VVPVGQELLTTAAVLDADDAGFGELAHRPVDGLDRGPPRGSASGMCRETHEGLHGQSDVKRLRVGASVGTDCSRRPGIDR
jgi:hypothetical protein